MGTFSGLMGHNVEAEANEAYADILGKKGRRLGWIASSPMSVAEFEMVAGRTVPSYNEFDPVRVGKWLEKHDTTGHDLAVWFAREMSPAIYVTGPEEVLLKLQRSAKRSARADEMDLYMQGYTVEPYDPEHGGRTTSFRFNEPVLRLWWD